MQNTERHANDTIPWPVWLAVILLVGILGDASVSVFFSPWIAFPQGILWVCAFAALSGRYLIQQRAKSRRETLRYFGVLTFMLLVAGILGITSYQSDERVIRTFIHHGETVFILTFGAICTVTWIGLKSSVCDRYFESTAAKITAHVLVPLFIVFTLSSAYWHFSHYSERKYVRGMKPTCPEIMLVDSETKKPLAEMRMLPSTSAPLGMDGSFSDRHHPKMSALSLGKGMTTSVGLKTCIAEPLLLRFGSDGYEPAEVVIQPGHEGRIELELKPVANKLSATVKP